MMKGTAFLLCCALSPGFARGQDGEKLSHADCTDPIELRVNRKYTYAQSPQGPGEIQEFGGNGRRQYLFPAEINTVWYRFTAPAGGEILIDIRPFRPQDDYDWMLFRQQGALSCDSIANYGQLPLRSNRARNDLGIDGRTGLDTAYSNLHAPPGPGKSYSKPLPVKAGESYLLVLDNIYPGGEGHEILISYKGQAPALPVRISGKVRDKASAKPLSAGIQVLEDSSGHSLWAGNADPGGNFALEVSEGQDIYISALQEGYVLSSLSFRAGKADTNLVLEMEPAQKGAKMILFNIRFQPNKAEFMPGSLPELRRLLEFMQQASGKSIRITGHTNPNVFTSRSFLLDLSVYRAAAVRDFLIEHGVDARRIRIAGAGGSRPLTESQDRKEAMKNLRVEIELLN